VTIPKSICEALAHPHWLQVMLDEVSVLRSSGTWELVPLSFGKFVIGCR